jgi:hypothetical protein
MPNFLDRVLIATDHVADLLDMGARESGTQSGEKMSILASVP